MKLLHVCLCLLSYAILSSCATAFNQPMKTQDARLGEITEQTRSLRNLPKPQKKIIASVYKFRDQTGQYKPSETGGSFSTAVTQGATSILLKAMDDSDWFVVIERENQNNLLNERRLYESSRIQYMNETKQPIRPLPSLIYADVVLEGGIVSYDSNIVTGGAGLRYFGVGGSTRYREDRVTVYLRAVSIKTGEVLKSVYTSKTILSQSLQANLFKYVKLRRLLEAEVGFTYNEPSQLVVTEAIEKALESLIIEGLMDDVWPSKRDKSDLQLVFDQYRKEKELAESTELFDRFLNPDQRGSFALSLGGTASRLYGDYAGSNFQLGAKAGLDVMVNSSVSLQGQFSRNRIKIRDFADDNYNQFDFNLKYMILPYDKMTPYIKVGGSYALSNSEEFNIDRIFGANYRGGIEYMLKEKIGFYGEAGQTLFFTDNIDGLTQGNRDDYLTDIHLGFSFYINNQSRAERIQFKKQNSSTKKK